MGTVKRHGLCGPIHLPRWRAQEGMGCGTPRRQGLWSNIDLSPRWGTQEGGGHVATLMSFHPIPTGRRGLCSQIAVTLRWGPRDGKGYVARSMSPYNGTQQGRIYVPALFSSHLLLPSTQIARLMNEHLSSLGILKWQGMCGQIDLCTRWYPLESLRGCRRVAVCPRWQAVV